MWEDIMDSDNGKEFNSWLKSKYSIGYSISFTTKDKKYRFSDDIILNLAVSFLEEERSNKIAIIPLQNNKYEAFIDDIVIEINGNEEFNDRRSALMSVINKSFMI